MATTIQEAVALMNSLGGQQKPFLFIIDFDMVQPVVLPLDEVDPAQILFEINGKTNRTVSVAEAGPVEFSAEPVSRERYARAFDLVQQHILHGDSFLLNLTMPSRIHTNLSLKEIFVRSRAGYKLWYKDRFVVFSPEAFIKTKEYRIRSFPMKGTIDARVPDAKEKLRSSRKELAEHYTIVDLIRNDLSMIAENVVVEKFQHIEEIRAHSHGLLQMSSVIAGDLPRDYRHALGDMIFSILPAGSISGAPKLKTVEVIKKAEQYHRGYYTGVFGLFDGKDIDCGVMIRYIERDEGGLVYKSGGGVTAMSNLDEEYRELIDKIYLPL